MKCVVVCKNKWLESSAPPPPLWAHGLTLMANLYRDSVDLSSSVRQCFDLAGPARPSTRTIPYCTRSQMNNKIYICFQARRFMDEICYCNWTFGLTNLTRGYLVVILPVLELVFCMFFSVI